MIHSYSSLSCWLKCPQQFHARYVARSVRAPDTPEIQLGKDIHARLETALNEGRNPDNVWTPTDLVPKMAAAGARAEAKLAMTREGDPCDFFSPQAWLRGAVDVLYVGDYVFIIDYKTGKFYPDELQADIYTTLVRANYGQGLTVLVYLLYIVAKRSKQFVVDDNAEHRVRSLIQRCENDETFDMYPSKLCGWCPVTQCIHHP